MLAMGVRSLLYVLKLVNQNRDLVNIPPPPKIDQVKILRPSAKFKKLKFLSAACKMLDSDCLNIPKLEAS